MSDQKLNIKVTAEDHASSVFDHIKNKIVVALDPVHLLEKGFEFLKDAMKETIGAAADQQKVFAQMDQTLKNTGNAVGLTRDEIIEFSEKLSGLSGVDNDVIMSGQNLLLTFKNLKGEGFEAATKAALDMDTVFTQGNVTTDSLRGTMFSLGRVLNSPIESMRLLRGMGISLNEAEKEEIKTLVESGRLHDAQAIILKRVEEKYGDAAEAIGNTFAGSVKKAHVQVEEIEKRIGSGLIPILKQMADSSVNSAKSIGEFLNIDRIAIWVKTLRTLIEEIGYFGEFSGRAIINAVGDVEKAFVKLMVLYTKYISHNKKSELEWSSTLAEIKENQALNTEKLEVKHKENLKKIQQDYLETIHGVNNAAKNDNKKIQEDITIDTKKELDQRAKDYETLKKTNQEIDDETSKNIKDSLDLELSQNRFTAQEGIKLMNAVLDASGITGEKRVQLQLEIASKIKKIDEDLTEKIEKDLAGIFDNILGSSLTLGDKLKATGIEIKKYLRSQLHAWAAAEVAKITMSALGAAIPTFGASLAIGAGQVALVGAEVAAGDAALDAIPFASGGVVPGNSTSGDNVSTQLNSGEMVLNKAQQDNLFKMINNYNGAGSGGSGGNIVLQFDAMDGEELAKLVDKQFVILKRKNQRVSF